MVKVGLIADGFDSTAALPAGRLVKDHAKVSGWPSMSLDADPSNCTTLVTNRVWSGPALATGEELLVFTTIVSGAELTVPSLTTSWIT